MLANSRERERERDEGYAAIENLRCLKEALVSE
jgi:hypothetical protein